MIEINEQYSMEHDGVQWKLLELTHEEGEEKENGKGTYDSDIYRTVGYFYSLDQVAKKLINILDTSEVETIQELQETYSDLISVITNLLEEEAHV